MGDKAYLARAIPNTEEFGVIPNENKTPYVDIRIQLFDEDENPTDVVTWRGWCSAKAVPGTYERLRMLGARVADDDIGDLEGLGTKKVSVTITTDRFGTWVEYMNPIGGRTSNGQTKMSGADLDGFRAKMKAQIAAARIAAGSVAPAPSATPLAPASGGTKKPFNWKPPAADPLPAGQLPAALEAEMAQAAALAGEPAPKLDDIPF
jgi:hypothetical protein